MVATLLQGLSSCYDYSKEEPMGSPLSPGMVSYINLTVSVRGSGSVTRGTPLGGEDGDGREKGIDTRENVVEGVTIVFFRNDAGINATDASAAATPIDFVAYYPTQRDDSYRPRTGTHYPDEVYYTTGEQVLDQALDATKTYHILVVANANLVGTITTYNLKQVRDMVYSSALYQGTTVADATKFVMTSADDNVLTFSDYTDNVATNRRIFQFDNIHIERMAARIDYWAKGATYTTAYDDRGGYLYDVEGSASDKFVLTSIEPFNLNGGNEYLFKRTSDATSPYLANETQANWVVGPYSQSQTAAAHPSYMVSTNTLTAVAGKAGVLAIALDEDDKVSVEGEDDIIILAYPKENTIGATTPIYYYATGLAFEGYYYKDGAKTGGERRVYYHFLRHQGEQSVAYNAINAEGLAAFDKSTTIGSDGTPMNFGIVRNNIYRVSVDKINAAAGTIRLTIEEKPWRYVEHPAIYL